MILIDIGSNGRNSLKFQKEVIIFLIYDVPSELNTYRLVISIYQGLRYIYLSPW